MKNETSPATPPATGDAVASAYIAAEIVKARKDLRRSRIIGAVLVGVVGTYIAFISATLVHFFQPREAAQVASGMMMQHIGTDGSALTAQLEQQVPLLIRQLPDYALAQLPRYRVELELTLESELHSHCLALSKDIGMQVDLLLDAHRDEIKNLLAHANDRAALRQSLPDLDEAIATYLATDPEGRTIHRRITDLAAELKEIEVRMGRLADNKNLTPEEQKARRTVAVLAKAIKNQVNQDQPAAAPARKLASR